MVSNLSRNEPGQIDSLRIDNFVGEHLGEPPGNLIGNRVGDLIDNLLSDLNDN